MKKFELQKLVQIFYPLLILKLVDTNIRVRKDAISSIILLAQKTSIQDIVSLTCENLTMKTHPKQWSGKLHLLESLVSEFKLKQYPICVQGKEQHPFEKAKSDSERLVSEGKINIEEIARVLNEAFKTPNVQVKTDALKLVTSLYKCGGDDVLKYFHNTNPAALAVRSTISFRILIVRASNQV